MSDLGPHICTFKDCTAQLFHSRQEWAQHESGMHRKKWRCKFCPGESSTSETILHDHLRERHPECTGQQTSSLLSLSGKPWDFIPMSCCLFCQWQPKIREQSQPIHPEPGALSPDMYNLEVPSEEFYKHVGHHLEQLALFALPPQMKQASLTSSNRAIAIHLSHETRSQASFLASDSFHGYQFPEVFQSIAKGDMGRLEQLLSTGASVFAHHPQFGGILQIAVAFGSFEALPLLLEHGAEPNVPGGEYGSALQAIAAHSGPRLDALQLLIAHGADVNASGRKFGHALVAAAATEPLSGAPEYESTSAVIRELLSQGSDVNAWGPNHGTALQVSLARRDIDSACLLVNMGADPLVQMGEFEMPVEIAWRNGDEAFIEHVSNSLEAIPSLPPADTPYDGDENFALWKRYIAERRKSQLALRYAAAVSTKAELEKTYNALVEKTAANQARAVEEEVKTEYEAAAEKAAADQAAVEGAAASSPPKKRQRPLKLSDAIGQNSAFHSTCAIHGV